VTIFKNMVDVDTLFIHSDELPWVSNEHGSYRLLQVREEDHLVVGHYRVNAGLVSALHRHLGPSLLYTFSGTWGHRPEVMDHRAGTYVYEPTGALHRYYGGTEVELIDVSLGDTENFTDEGDVADRATVDVKVRRYFELCEEQGFGRPNLLG
jgi:hypothetical protein